jgi:hypothetical protein
VADVLDYKGGAIVNQFKPQELSNSAWGTATLLGKRNGPSQSHNHNGDHSSSDDDDEDHEVEDDAAQRILRWVAQALVERVDDFKPQESKFGIIYILDPMQCSAEQCVCL